MFLNAAFSEWRVIRPEQSSHVERNSSVPWLVRRHMPLRSLIT
jgi:hypothetical protein